MKSISFKKFIPGIAWFFIVAVVLFMPGNNLPPNAWMDAIYFDKWVHVGLFGILAFLFMVPLALSGMEAKRLNQWLIVIAVSCSAWGFITECIQYFYISERSFDIFDWVADSTGIAAAYLIKKIINKRSRNQV